MLENKGDQSTAAIQKWYLYEQEILNCLAAVLHLTIGPCFCSFQCAILHYSSSPGHSRRNLYMVTSMAQKRIILANPHAKQANKTTAETLMTFPNFITLQVAFYFTIIRPAEIALMSRSGSIPKAVSKLLDAYSTFIWAWQMVHSHENFKTHWEGHDFDRGLQTLTFPTLKFSLTGHIACQVAHAVFWNQFPLLFQGLSEFKET